MATVFDVAAYILTKTGAIPAMKLQKLVYYAQAWSLVWDDKPLFPERIEGWANGPVCPALYKQHRGKYAVERLHVGDASSLTSDEKETIDAVIDYYAGRKSQWLSDLTHSETPWQEARRGLMPGEAGDKEITHASMAEYYGGI